MSNRHYQIRIETDEAGVQRLDRFGLRPILHVASGEAAERLGRLDQAGCYVLDLGGAYYGGTAGRLGRRLREHLASAGTDLRRVIAIVSEPGMTSLEAEHLEHLLLAALARGRVPLLNHAAPGPRRLRAAETRAVEALWASTAVLLRAIGIDVPAPAASELPIPDAASGLDALQLTRAGDLHVLICDRVHAVVWHTARGWLVMPGSLIRRDPVASAPARARADRERLMAEGRLVETADRGC